MEIPGVDQPFRGCRREHAGRERPGRHPGPTAEAQPRGTSARDAETTGGVDSVGLSPLFNRIGLPPPPARLQSLRERIRDHHYAVEAPTLSRDMVQFFLAA